MSETGGTSARRKVTGKIELPLSQQTRPGPRSSPASYAHSPSSNAAPPVPTFSRSNTSTPVQPRARARVNITSVATPTPSPAASSSHDGLPRATTVVSGSGGSTLGRRALVRAATTPNTLGGQHHESPGTPTAMGSRTYTSGSPSLSHSTSRSDLGAPRNRLGGNGMAKVNREALDSMQESRKGTVATGTIGRSGTTASISSPASIVAGPSSRPLLPPLPIGSPASFPTSDGISPRSSAREAARLARQSRALDDGMSAVATPPRSGDPMFARSPSIVSDRSSVSFRSSEVASSVGASLRSPRVAGLDSTPQTDMSSYGSLRDDKAFSLDQAILQQSGGAKKLSMSSEVVVEDEGDEVGRLDTTEDSVEVEDGVRDAKRDRKIADLEISNKSLMTINRNLEAEAARKNRLIISLKRQLRASAAGLSAGDVGGSASASRRSLGLKTDLEDDLDILDFDENDEVAQDCLREAGVLDSSLDKANDTIEALIKKGKEAMRKVEDIKEGAKGKVLGVLELEEQEGMDGDSEEDTDARTPPLQEDDTIDGRASSEIPKLQGTVDEGRNDPA